MRLRNAAHVLLVSVAVALPVLVVGFAPTAAVASTDDYSFTSMSSDFSLGRDAGGNATLRTVETLVAVFPAFDQNHGIERAIPLMYGDANLNINVVGVTDGHGSAMPYTRSDSNGFAVLRIGSADTYVHGSVTYRIEYTSRNVVRSFADTASDEFYWDVNGTGWPQQFGTVSATVHLENGIESTLTGNNACYFGYEGSKDRCDITRTGTTISASVAGLLPYQNMTVAIGFDPATFVDPPILKNQWYFAILPWVLLGLTGAALLFLLCVRLFVWRDARGRGIIIPEYSPHPDAYPMLAAELLKRTQSALPAQIVRFAVAHVLAIRERPTKPKDTRYQLELLAGWPAAPENERWVLKSLFDEVAVGEKVVLNPRTTDIGDRFEKYKNHAASLVKKKGWRAKPTTRIPRILRWTTFGIAAVALAIRFISVWFNVDAPAIDLAAFGCSVGWLIVAFLATPPFVMTAKGAEVRDYLLGIRDYVSLAEADRIRMLQAPDTAERIDVTDESAVIKLYEKLLPYAMIFGIENQWIAELGRHYSETEQPNWYTGNSNLAGIAVFGNQIAATHFSSTPPPSSSSGSSWSSSGGGSSFSGGSSGGGFSGGGGGGGGGGGW